jgi:hypothetical protein
MADPTSLSYTDPSFWQSAVYSPKQVFGKLFNKAYTDKINSPNDLTYASPSSLDPTASTMAAGFPNYVAPTFGQTGTDTGTGARDTPLSSQYGMGATAPGDFYTTVLRNAINASIPYQAAVQHDLFQEAVREAPFLQRQKNIGDVMGNMAAVSYQQTSPIKRQEVNASIADSLYRNQMGEAALLAATAQAQNAASNFAALGSSPRGNRTFG